MYELMCCAPTLLVRVHSGLLSVNHGFYERLEVFGTKLLRYLGSTDLKNTSEIVFARKWFNLTQELIKNIFHIMGNM